jgi:hypothetical protein
MRFALILAALCATIGSESKAKDTYVTGFDAAKVERIRQWQAELTARELEIERASLAWLPPPSVGPVANVARDRPTYMPVVAVMDAPLPHFAAWTLAERRSFYLRPYAHEYAFADFAQPRYVPMTPTERVGQRIGAQVGGSLAGQDGAAIGAQAGRAVVTEFERR